MPRKKPHGAKPLSARIIAEINVGWNAGYMFWIEYLLEDAMAQLRKDYVQRRLAQLFRDRCYDDPHQREIARLAWMEWIEWRESQWVATLMKDSVLSLHVRIITPQMWAQALQNYKSVLGAER